jgi:hypothetical protein
MSETWLRCRPAGGRSPRTPGRGKYVSGLRRVYERGELHFAGGITDLADGAAFEALLQPLYTTAFEALWATPTGWR